MVTFLTHSLRFPFFSGVAPVPPTYSLWWHAAQLTSYMRMTVAPIYMTVDPGATKADWWQAAHMFLTHERAQNAAASLEGQQLRHAGGEPEVRARGVLAYFLGEYTAVTPLSGASQLILFQAGTSMG